MAFLLKNQLKNQNKLNCFGCLLLAKPLQNSGGEVNFATFATDFAHSAVLYIAISLSNVGSVLTTQKVDAAKSKFPKVIKMPRVDACYVVFILQYNLIALCQWLSIEKFNEKNKNFLFVDRV